MMKPTNITAYLSLLILAITLIGCKSNQKIIYEKATCYTIKDGITYLNVHNASDSIVQIPNLHLLTDEKFFLIKNYFRLSNDTLYIRPVQVSDYHNADSFGETTTTISGESVDLKKEESKLMGFRTNEKFTTIVLTGYNRDVILPECYTEPQSNIKVIKIK